MTCSSFLTKEGQPSKRFVTKKIAAGPARRYVLSYCGILDRDYKKAMSACESENDRALYVVGRYVATAYARQLQLAVWIMMI